MEKQRVRIRDIAEELGLSTATVSNVIHGKTHKVSEKTVWRVQALLEERQYIPSMAGILLAQNDSKIIGVFINDHEKYQGHTLEDAFIASSLNYLSTEMEAAGFFMMVKKAKRPEEIIQFASMWNMDGVVVIGFCHQDYRYLRGHMRIPFVVYDGVCQQTDRIVNITLDNFDGGMQMGRFFQSRGHKKALCITDNRERMDSERIEGFCQGFAGEWIEVLEIPIEKEKRWTFYKKKREIFHLVTGVFAVSDVYALDLIQFLKQEGFRVPEEISVAGFDDIPLCQMSSPPLTTIRQDGEQRAKIAMQKLQELKSMKETDTEITLPVMLVERESVAQRLSV